MWGKAISGGVLMLGLLLLAMPEDAGAQRWPRRLPGSGRIPVLAWMGPPAEHTTPERYRELADAGFTHNFTPFPNLEAMQKGLDVARGAGIMQFVAVPELASDPEGTARRFKDHPALAGYHLRDEPSAADFPALATWVKRIQSVDREHPCYINLFPNYASPEQLGTPTYRAHVERFLAEVPVPFLSYDHYPVLTGEKLRPEYYENLEIASRAARKAGLPLWAFTLAVAHDPYPIAKLEHMRLQVFSDLAYGAQAIQYFTYWTPRSTVWNFHEGPMDPDGRRTEVYDRVKQLNAEIRGLSPVFLGARVVRVGHTGELPRRTEQYQPEAPIRAVRTEDGGAVASLLEKDGRRFLVLVNRSLTAPLPVTVEVDGSRTVREVRKDGTLLSFKGRAFSAALAPGDLAVLTWKAE